MLMFIARVVIDDERCGDRRSRSVGNPSGPFAVACRMVALQGQLHLRPTFVELPLPRDGGSWLGRLDRSRSCCWQPSGPDGDRWQLDGVLRCGHPTRSQQLTALRAAAERSKDVSRTWCEWCHGSASSCSELRAHLVNQAKQCLHSRPRMRASEVWWGLVRCSFEWGACAMGTRQGWRCLSACQMLCRRPVRCSWRPSN